MRRRAVVVGLVVVVVLVACLPLGVALKRGTRDIVQALHDAPAGHIRTRTLETTNQHELVEIVIEDGVGTVRATLRLPREARAAAALIIVGGLRTGRDAVHLLDADLPCAVAAIDYAGDVPRDVDVWDVVRVPRLQRDMVRSAVALRDLAAYLAREPRVDPERVFLVGASLGVPFATAVAAVNPPSGLVLLHGFADHAALVEHRLASSVRSVTARRVLAQLSAGLTAGFDARRTLPRVRDVPVLVVEAAQDDVVPARCRRALWNATPEPRERVRVPGGHLDAARRQQVLAEAIAEARRWLSRRGVPELSL